MARVDVTTWPVMSEAIEVAQAAGTVRARTSEATGTQPRAGRSQPGRGRGARGSGSPARPNRGRWLAVASVLVVGIFVVGVVAALSIQPKEAASEAGASVSAAGTPFPIVAYRGADILGAEELDFHQLLGTGTPVVLNFWAGQCPPCRAEMPDFQRVYDRHAREFLLVGVDIGPFVGLGSHESAQALLEELGISYPTAYAVDAAAVRDNQVLGMPTTIFYGGDGVEVDRVSGLLTEDAFEARIRDLIGPAT